MNNLSPVIDCEKLLDKIAKDTKGYEDQKKDKYLDGHGHSNLNGAIEALQELTIAIDRGDFNSAVPSAPDGAERVKAAFSEITNIVDDRFQHNSRFPWPSFEKLRDSIAALGQPQGSDSLRWTTTIPTEMGYYWRKNQVGTIDMIAVIEAHGHLDYMIFGLSGSADCVERMAKSKYEFCRIPEPAQPASDGEAKERGE